MKIKKLISLLIIVLIILNTIQLKSNAMILNFDGEFEVKQITSEDQVKKDSSTNYIIVFDYGDGRSYALASEGYGNWDFAMIKENAEQVVLKDDGKTVGYNGSRSILWNFNKSSKTIDNGDENFVISSTEQVYWWNPSHVNVRQLEFGDTTNDAQCGIRYREHASDMKFHFQEDGTVKIEQLIDSAYNWLGFYTAENRWTATIECWATTAKLYEVIERYSNTQNYVAQVSENPQYPEVGSVSIDKTKTLGANYDETGITNVKLTTNAIAVEKDLDVVIAYDNSNYTMQPIEGTQITRETQIETLVENLSLKVLEENENNRVALVAFANSIQNEEASRNMAFTQDIEEIRAYLALDRDNQRPGTDYTRGLYEVSNIIENYASSSRDCVLIFITDGVASVFNRTNCTIYQNTEDGEVGHHADNWMDYVLNTDLKQLDYIKQSGVEVFSINTQSNDFALIDDGSFVVTPDDTTDMLENLTPGNVYRYDIAVATDEELDTIFEDMAYSFYINPDDSVVVDKINTDFKLQNKTISNVASQIVIKEDDEVIETITFSDDGIQAFSSLLGNENILTNENGNLKIQSVFLTYDEQAQTIRWNINELFMHEYSLEYPVYLMNTIDAYDDGYTRKNGEYDISQNAYLEYTNALNQRVSLNFPEVNAPWTNEVQEITDNGEAVKTGDNIIYIILGLGISIMTLVIYLNKNKEK